MLYPPELREQVGNCTPSTWLRQGRLSMRAVA